jgi:phage terminase large subunit-like protein
VWWIETFCVHGPGDVQGQQVQLDDEFAGFVVDCYALGGTGRRLYDSIFLSRAKGRAKSELAGFIVLFEAMGPCRFDRWAEGGEVYEFQGASYVYTAGEPIGHEIVSPIIRCLATEEDQAGNTYDNVHYNLTQGPFADYMPNGAAGLTRVFLPGGGEILPSTASDSAKDGGKETLVVFDETHLYNRPALKRMYATVRRNLTKRKAAEPWSLETSTMYAPGEKSVAEETHALAQKIFEGKTKRQRLMFDHREAPAGIDMTDEKQIVEGLKEAYGPFAEVMDLDRLVSEIYDARNDPQDSRRYYFNQATSSKDAWLSAPEWNACFSPESAIHHKDTITLGFDGSRRRSRGIADATALIGCRVSDGFLFELQIWEQPDGPEGEDWEVPMADVDAAVRGAFRDYNVVGFYADPAKWESYIATWEADFGKKLKVRATVRHPIEWWVSGGRSYLMVRAIEQFESAVISGELIHDGARAMTRHMLNARRRIGRSGMQIAKENPDSPKKMDAAVAGTLAYAARLDAVAKNVTKSGSFVPKRLR